jgi:hypothetical protein
MFNSKTTFTLAAAVVAMATAANAAVITWGTPQAISGPSDVSTNGTLVEAYYVDNTGATTLVNGVPFKATDFGNGPYGNANASTGDANYDTILKKRNEAGTGGNGFTTYVGEQDGNRQNNTGGALVIGELYEIQLWWNDSSSGTYTGGAMRLTAGNTVDVPWQYYVIGTFTADATEQAIHVNTIETGGNGTNQTRDPAPYQIRQIVPEPASLAAGLVGLTLIAGRRRR